MARRLHKNGFKFAWIGFFTTVFIALLSLGGVKSAFGGETAISIIENHCTDCHDDDISKGDLNLAAILPDEAIQHTEVWEKVIRRLRTRQMPPASKRSRPSESEYKLVLKALTKQLDAAAASEPNPGRTESIRRLNRTEYQNAIRDLLALEIDASTLLPADDSSHGFDNVAVAALSPTLLDRYLTAAQKISHLAIGTAMRVPGGDTIRIRPDRTQQDWLEGLPFGTRGGAVIPYTFPRDGEYEFTFRLARDRNDEVEGLREPHKLIVLRDRIPVQTFTVKPPPRGKGHNDVDKHLSFRVPVKAGPTKIGITFLNKGSSLLEYKRQPYEAQFNYHRHPRMAPALFQVSIVGPYNSSRPGNTPSRRRIFSVYPKTQAEEEECAQKIIANLLRRAWRRPVEQKDVKRLMPFFREGKNEVDFETGIEMALSAILTSSEFLFRLEQDPAGLPTGTPYRLNDFELASRLSFFLWSSIPDDELLNLAGRSQLRNPEVLARQTRRMLADERSQSLVKNFAAQWLHLRNLDSATPDGRLFTDFDDNLRQAMRRETELVFEEMIRQDRSVLMLLKQNHTYLNERLAKHYGIPHIYGSHFRRIPLESNSHRGGLLRHASILTVTSYATRTTPVIRGKWILENLIGTPPQPPLPDVPALDDTAVSEQLPIRERLAAHRDKPACASCHEFIDPPGFALENFDAIGRWRTLDRDKPVDASGGLPDGSKFMGADGLEVGLLKRPEIFVTTFVEKLLTFALGRGVEHYDAPAIRKVVRQAREEDYRFSKIILGIVESVPFQMRRSS